MEKSYKKAKDELDKFVAEHPDTKTTIDSYIQCNRCWDFSGIENIKKSTDNMKNIKRHLK